MYVAGILVGSPNKRNIKLQQINRVRVDGMDTFMFTTCMYTISCTCMLKSIDCMHRRTWIQVILYGLTVKASILWLVPLWAYGLSVALSTRLIVHKLSYFVNATFDWRSSSIDRPETLRLLKEISRYTIDRLLRIAISNE